MIVCFELKSGGIEKQNRNEYFYNTNVHLYLIRPNIEKCFFNNLIVN